MADIGNWPAACRVLLDFYSTCDSGSWLRFDSPVHADEVDAPAERMAHGFFPVPGGEVQIPRRDDGHLDWGHVPAVAGGEEWCYGINRHDYMADLLAAFRKTGNRLYARALDEQLRDWCAMMEGPPSEARQQPCPWGTILEVGHRVKNWPAIFYGLMREPELAPATRILVLAQALEHARFLRRRFSGGTNWVITEMAGLLSVACAWPEFKDADEWRECAVRVTQEELRAQVYPDGVQKELSSNYQAAVLWHMDFFVATMRGAGLAVPVALAGLLESMWDYLACSLGPLGQFPHNGDSDRCDAAASAQVIKPLESVEPLVKAAEHFGRPDWLGIATHGGRGTLPVGTPSRYYPWAAQMIMRSGWDREAQWAFFDGGPWGLLHQQNDMLHLSVTACGRDLLVDSGRYTYQNYFGEPGTWRSYFISSLAHNVILVDGLLQHDGPRVVESPLSSTVALITPEFDYVQARFEYGFSDMARVSARLKTIMYGQSPAPLVPMVDDVRHTRAVVYLRGIGWVVVDRLTAAHAHRITALWHYHPDCTVARDGDAVVTVDPGLGNLRMQPLGCCKWDVEFVRGREGPDFQGWYSTEMDVKAPNTCACWHAEIAGPATFGWLILTQRGDVPAATAELREPVDGEVGVDVRLADGRAWSIGLAMGDPHPGGGARCAVRRTS